MNANIYTIPITQPDLPPEIPPNTTEDAFEGVDPTTLYMDTGEVNYDAVRALLDVWAQQETRPFEGVADDSNFQVTLPLSIDDEQEKSTDTAQETLPQPGSVEYAIFSYMTLALLQQAEITTPTLPTSPELAKNPFVKLDLQTEATRYFGEMQKNQSNKFALAESAQASMGESPNDANDLECVVAIPVAGHQEYGNIFHTLEQFATLDLPHDKFEIFLDLNLPGRDTDEDFSLADSLNLTLNELERFKSEYPDVVVRHFANVYRGAPPLIGDIRADLWNTVGYDLFKRGREKDIMVVSSDADIIRLNKPYLSDMAKTFNSSDADIVTAKLRWQQIPGLPYTALANRILRYQSFLDDLRDKNATMLHTSDANTGISLAAYMGVGGYDRSKKLGEMSNLVSRIRYFRQTPDQKEEPTYTPPANPIELKADNAVLRTNSRRLILAMGRGASPYRAWDQRLIKFGSDDSLRTEAMQGDAAEHAAQQFARQWISEMTGPYVRHLEENKRRRILNAAHKIFGFNDLYSSKH